MSFTRETYFLISNGICYARSRWPALEQRLVIVITEATDGQGRVDTLGNGCRLLNKLFQQILTETGQQSKVVVCLMSVHPEAVVAAFSTRVVFWHGNTIN